ncbi:MAG: amidohydrolase family protein [Candidatus Nitrosocosmicus sp.]|nr:amidohydrolase family protein [Candidatus Nitrosocosmicus sp.]MDN5867228.1 amidohydrolase family protein [Candidatus Nitrosocosmicus sp.]
MVISSIYITTAGYSIDHIFTIPLHDVYASNDIDPNKTSVPVVETMNSSSPEDVCYVLAADRLFDGYTLYPNKQQPDTNTVLIKGEKVVRIGAFDNLKKECNNRVSLGDFTIMPGFIESHAHITFGDIPKNKVLEHGITTAQDTGGPMLPSEGGNGTLRLLSVGPIIQAPGGYPLNIFGGTSGLDQIGYTVTSVTGAENLVQKLVDGGSTAIKIALEPGGEEGAPWIMPHGPDHVPATPWPILSQEIVNAIVTKAHSLDKRVIAHVGEEIGFQRAVNAGVDEMAHIPCAPIPESLMRDAVAKGITFVTTVDTLSSCVGTHANLHLLAQILENNQGTRSEIIYGSEIAHEDVPWGINGHELQSILHLTSGESIDFDDVVKVIRSATSQGGKHLGVDNKLGTLSSGAPADLIIVRGNPFMDFKLLEYPDLVMSGGHIVIDHINAIKKSHIW